MASKIDNTFFASTIILLNIFYLKNIDIQNDYKKETMQQQIKRKIVNIDGNYIIIFLIIIFLILAMLPLTGSSNLPPGYYCC